MTKVVMVSITLLGQGAYIGRWSPSLPAPWEIFTQVPCPDGHYEPLFMRVARFVHEPSTFSS